MGPRVRRASGFLLTALSNARRTAVFLFSLWRRRASDKALALLGSNPQLSDWSNRTTLWRGPGCPRALRKEGLVIKAVAGGGGVFIFPVKNHTGLPQTHKEDKGSFGLIKGR